MIVQQVNVEELTLEIERRLAARRVGVQGPGHTWSMPILADLVIELMGSKLVAEMISTGWQWAREDQRRRFAETILDRLIEEAGKPDASYAVRVAIEQTVAGRVKEIVQAEYLNTSSARVQEFETSVRGVIDARWQDAVQRVCAEAARGAVGVVEKVVQEGLRKAFADFPPRVK